MTDYQVIDPFDGRLVAAYPTATPAVIETTLQEAAAWRGTAAKRPKRAALLLALAAVFEQNKETLAKAVTRNMGKRLSEALAEVQGSIGVLRYYATHGVQALQTLQRQYQQTRLATIAYAPTGVVLAIEPWNFPYTQVIRVLAPNFLLGNPVILKHAPGVAECAELLVAQTQAAGWPKGAFANLFLTNEQAESVIADERVQGVALTGSQRAGRAVAAEAGAALTKVTLELGGNDAFIVLADADVQAAAAAAVGSRLRNAGQVCVSAKRYIVEQAVAPAFTAAVKALLANQVLGDPRDPATTLAPLSSTAALERLDQQVQNAVAHGASVLVQGGPAQDIGPRFYRPVLLGDLRPDNPEYDSEFFGPVAQLHVVADDRAAIALANASAYGLAGTVFGAPDHARQVAEQLHTGQVFLNQQAVAQPELPFGGVGHSGFGREMSEQALFEFAAIKVIAG